MDTFAGGCFCGAVRYAVRGAPSVVTLCHCSICRRSVGAQSVAWATFASAALELTDEALVWHRSSAHARRGFCGFCGTSLFFASERHPDEIDISVGSLDNPSACPATCHIFVPDKVSWVALGPDLPRHVADSSSELCAPME